MNSFSLETFNTEDVLSNERISSSFTKKLVEKKEIKSLSKLFKEFT